MSVNVNIFPMRLEASFEAATATDTVRSDAALADSGFVFLPHKSGFDADSWAASSGAIAPLS
jgi:hypothetical protein